MEHKSQTQHPNNYRAEPLEKDKESNWIIILYSMQTMPADHGRKCRSYTADSRTHMTHRNHQIVMREESNVTGIQQSRENGCRHIAVIKN